VTPYARIHVLGKGPNFSDMERQNLRYHAKTKWATDNPDSLLTPIELEQFLQWMEREQPEPPKSKRKRRVYNYDKIDANVYVDEEGTYYEVPEKQTQEHRRKKIYTKSGVAAVNPTSSGAIKVWKGKQQQLIRASMHIVASHGFPLASEFAYKKALQGKVHKLWFWSLHEACRQNNSTSIITEATKIYVEKLTTQKKYKKFH